MAPVDDDRNQGSGDLDAFGRKLEEARQRESSGRIWNAPKDGAPKSALGLAFRVSVELVSALAVGVAIGLGLDYMLGTKPWLLVAFIVLGFAAGVLNVYRMAAGYGYAVGYRKNEAPQSAPKEGEDRGG